MAKLKEESALFLFVKKFFHSMYFRERKSEWRRGAEGERDRILSRPMLSVEPEAGCGV